jgi:hypothetical protein
MIASHLTTRFRPFPDLAPRPACQDGDRRCDQDRDPGRGEGHGAEGGGRAHQREHPGLRRAQPRAHQRDERGGRCGVETERRRIGDGAYAERPEQRRQIPQHEDRRAGRPEGERRLAAVASAKRHGGALVDRQVGGEGPPRAPSAQHGCEPQAVEAVSAAHQHRGSRRRQRVPAPGHGTDERELRCAGEHQEGQRDRLEQRGPPAVDTAPKESP